MWRNRSELAARGVVLPGHHPQDHFRASQDLRGIAKLASDPAGSWTGEWEILARQAQQAGKVAVISHELFSAADAEQADRAVSSLLPAEVHVVLTVRDIATLLPAEWQETVKHRNARGVGGLARRRDRPGVGRCRPAPVVVLARARHAGDPRHLVPSAARGARARHHDPAPGIGQRAAVAALRVPARDRPRRRRPHPRPAERLARDAGDRVPAAAEPGPSRRGPRLVLHVERQGGGRPPGPGRPAARGASGAARQPGCLGQGPGGGTRSPPWATPGTTSSAIWTSSARRPPPGPTPARPTSRPSGCSTPP